MSRDTIVDDIEVHWSVKSPYVTDGRRLKSSLSGMRNIRAGDCVITSNLDRVLKSCQTIEQ